MKRLFIVGLAWLLVAMIPLAAQAHDGRPIVVDMKQGADHVLHVDLRFPNAINPRYRPDIRLPGNCQAIETSAVKRTNASYRYQSSYRCDKAITGQRVTLFFPAFNPSLSTQTRYKADGEPAVSALLTPGQLDWIIPAQPRRGQIWWDYIWFGITHIAKGWDHLLFVMLLLILARSPKRTVQAVTGFTLGHSLTLALAAMGHVSLSIGAVEALIALSLVVLAAELLRNRRETLVWRFPVLTSSLFGLLHGFGFASVLVELGLPSGHTLSALAAFNIGVELGQIIFVVVLFLGVRAAAILTRGRIKDEIASKALLYAIGLIASVWSVSRIIRLFASVA